MGRWIQLFGEGDASQRALLGGKGANLAEMARLGLPIPPGFTITTDTCRAFLENHDTVPDGLWDEVAIGLRDRAAGRSSFWRPDRPAPGLRPLRGRRLDAGDDGDDPQSGSQ